MLDAACQQDSNSLTDDPRRLRPGEIDPNPESKPARPDPVDMDEEEKEMLSEARARLANTKGKKAKRKAREKQLEEARRLASLQKRRELKAAGIDTVKRAKRVKGIDYNAEIPFERKPDGGLFDASDERQALAILNEETFKPKTLADFEGSCEKDVEESLKKQDEKRQRIVERHGVPNGVQTGANLNDSDARRQHNELNLPPPRVRGGELGHTIEARDIATLHELPSSHRVHQMLPDDKQARNSSGIGMSSSRDGISVSTISSPERYFVSKTRLSRRNAHVADGDDMITVGVVLKHAMTSLPVPNNEYQVVLPTPPKSDQTADDDFCHHIDADLIFSSFPLERLTHSKSALRNLDRPSFVRIETGDALMYNAAQIIRRELVNMIQYDISEFGANDEVQSLTSPISLRQMATSAALLSREITALKSRAGHQLLNGDEYMYTCRNSHTIWNIDTSTSHFTLGHLDGDDNGTAAHTRACSHMARDAQRAGRIEHKIEIVISGLQRRSAELQRRLQRACADLITTDNQYCSYNILLYHEKEVFSKRTEQLKSMIYTASEEERNRQCLHNQYLSQVALMQSSKHPMCE